MARWVLTHRTAWLTQVMRAVTVLGGSAVLVPLVVVAGVVLWRRRGSWAPLWFLAAAYGGAFVLQNVGKQLFTRPRPALGPALVGASGFAFPSGHATQSAAVWVALGLMVIPPGRTGRRARAARAAFGAVPFVVGLSRVYLGVHWLTDVLVGWALGLAWVRMLTVTRFGARAWTAGA